MTTKNSPSTVTFQRYDTEFREILQQIEQSLTVTCNNATTTANTNENNNNSNIGDGTSSYTNHLIQQGHDLLKQMSVEARTISSEQHTGTTLSSANYATSNTTTNTTSNAAVTKNELLNHVRTLKAQLTTLQSKVNSQSLFSTGSTSTGSNHNNNSHNSNSSQQQRYDKNRQLLDKNEGMFMQQNDTLERAKRSIMETEQVALEINDELIQNRQTLINSQNRIHQVSHMTNQARQLLSSMSQRQVQQKMILYGITICLILAFFFLLYTMWR